MLPPLSEKGKILFLTIAYPPNPTASAVVHKHLLDQFDPGSFVVISGFFPGAKKVRVPGAVKQHFIYLSAEFISSKLHRVLARLQRFTIPLLLGYHIRKIKPAKIVIGYPDLYWLDLCSAAAIKYQVPFVPYLHDTIEEAANSGPGKELARIVQHRIFAKAEKIAVMSEGMRALYKKKYNLVTTAWEHIYPEIPVKFFGEKEYRAHWSGDVYEINYKSVLRLNLAVEKLGLKFSISNGKTREQLKGYGISGTHIQKVFYPNRSEYLEHLSKSKIVLLGLNYPDECSIQEDELATIFSTKTPEYLGSGSLIVYNGPAHYFLAKFILDHHCGVVIDSRDEKVIFEKLEEVCKNYNQYQDRIENARQCLEIFSPKSVREKVLATLNG